MAEQHENDREKQQKQQSEEQRYESRRGPNRRVFLGTTAGLAGLAGIGVGAAQPAHASGRPGSASGSGSVPDPRPGDLVLTNGKIHTFDRRDTVVDAVLIRNGKIAAIGDGVARGRHDARTIDLEGRTVIPGLIDNHIHFIRLANLPGHTVRRVEGAFSVAAAQRAIADRAAGVPRGEFITLLGAITTGQFVEGRFPALAELDEAAPRHPVYISQSGAGPGQTNTLGRDALRGLGVTVGDDGGVAQGATTDLAYNRLAQSLTSATRTRQLEDESAFAASVGLTTVMDMSGTVPGVGFLDQATGYDFFLDMVRRDALKVRYRIFFPGFDDTMPLTSMQGLVNHRWREYGPDMAKIVGVGEWSVGRVAFQSPLGEVNRAATTLIAERGWVYHQHVISGGEIDGHLQLWEQLRGQGLPIPELRWSVGHLDGLTADHIERANELGVGLAVHPWRYLGGNALPPTRLAFESGEVAVGGGSDGARISTLNPWNMIYAMVTGRNNAGQQVAPPEQRVSRSEAIRMFAGPQQGWFSKEDDLLGGIGVGRFADLVVLERDVFNTAKVPDGALREMRSVLTVVGGGIAHDARVLRVR
jgi:predicted amidohydrolase YtcJ